MLFYAFCVMTICHSIHQIYGCVFLDFSFAQARYIIKNLEDIFQCLLRLKLNSHHKNLFAFTYILTYSLINIAHKCSFRYAFCIFDTVFKPGFHKNVQKSTLQWGFEYDNFFIERKYLIIVNILFLIYSSRQSIRFYVDLDISLFRCSFCFKHI